MEKYIGVNLIKAEPCTVDEFNAIRPLYYSGECQDGYKVEYEEGYISWSPKDVFEEVYRLTTGMTFGLAIEAMKKGFKVSRKGWNGKNQYIELASNISYISSAEKVVNCEHNDIGNKAIAFVGTSGVQMGWLASQADMLAEDWQIID